MSEEIVGVKIKVDGTDMNKSIGDLKKSIAETEAEIKSLSDAYGATSKEAQDAQKRLAQLQDVTNQKIEQQNQRIDNAAKTVSALSAAYGGVQGALELTGLAGEDTIKQLAKIQSALAIGDAVQNLAEFRGAITSTFSSMRSGAVKAFNAIKAGIGSTGIGVLLLALGAIVAYWDDIKEAVSGVSSEQKKLNESAKENLKTQEEKLDAIDGQTNQLKLQGKSEKEILNIKIKQTDEAIKAAEINLANAKATRDAQIKAAERNKNILQGLITMVTSPITAVLAGIDLIGKAVGKNFGLAEGFTGGLAKMVFDPEQTAKDADATIKEAQDGLNKLKEKRAGYQLSVNSIDEQAATKARDQAKKDAADAKEKADKAIEDAKKAREKELDKIIAGRLEQDELLKEIDDRRKESIKSIDPIIANQANLQIKTIGERVNAETEAQKKIDALRAEDAKNVELYEKAKADAYSQTANALGALGQIVGQETATGKALSAAQALINTYLGITQIWANKTTIPEPFGTIQKIASTVTAAASGFTAVKNIAKVKVPGFGGGGVSTPSLASITAPVGTQPPQAQLTQLNQASINQMGSAAGRAYVVESDITNQQEKIVRINRAARLA
jgi:chromosome segregation ATPase